MIHYQFELFNHVICKLFIDTHSVPNAIANFARMNNDPAELPFRPGRS